MTLHELSQLYWLDREIEADRQLLADLRARASGLHGQKLDGMPHAGGGGDALAGTMDKIIALEAKIAEANARRLDELAGLCAYIDAIPDSYTRQIFTLRFVNGFSWQQVADAIGRGDTIDSVKKACYRFLRNH